eukprot:2109507-Rhodomonas_salina.1
MDTHTQIHRQTDTQTDAHKHQTKRFRAPVSACINITPALLPPHTLPQITPNLLPPTSHDCLVTSHERDVTTAAARSNVTDSSPVTSPGHVAGPKAYRALAVLDGGRHVRARELLRLKRHVVDLQDDVPAPARRPASHVSRSRHARPGHLTDRKVTSHTRTRSQYLFTTPLQHVTSPPFCVLAGSHVPFRTLLDSQVPPAGCESPVIRDVLT